MLISYSIPSPLRKESSLKMQKCVFKNVQEMPVSDKGWQSANRWGKFCAMRALQPELVTHHTAMSEVTFFIFRFIYNITP
jgi:hypothetical protein